MIGHWLPVVGFPAYEVSDLGEVRSTMPYHGSTEPRLRKIATDDAGYSIVGLKRDGRNFTKKVHALVMEAFVGPCPEGLEVRHRDDVKSNNALTNLVYGTRSENMHDSVRNGTHTQSRKTECPSGHPYDAANTLIRPDGARRCRECARLESAGRRAVGATR